MWQGSVFCTVEVIKVTLQQCLSCAIKKELFASLFSLSMANSVTGSANLRNDDHRFHRLYPTVWTNQTHQYKCSPDFLTELLLPLVQPTGSPCGSGRAGMAPPKLHGRRFNRRRCHPRRPLREQLVEPSLNVSREVKCVSLVCVHGRLV